MLIFSFLSSRYASFSSAQSFAFHNRHSSRSHYQVRAVPPPAFWAVAFWLIFLVFDCLISLVKNHKQVVVPECWRFLVHSVQLQVGKAQILGEFASLNAFAQYFPAASLALDQPFYWVCFWQRDFCVGRFLSRSITVQRFMTVDRVSGDGLDQFLPDHFPSLCRFPRLYS